MEWPESMLVVLAMVNMGCALAGFAALMARALRGRSTPRRESLQGEDPQRQIADMRDEMTQMRDMMADLLPDMHDARGASTPAEQLSEGTGVDR